MDHKLASQTWRTNLVLASALRHIQAASRRRSQFFEEGEEAHSKAIEHHLWKSFTLGDANYLSQMRYARHALLYGDQDEAKKMFAYLRKQKLPPKFRDKVFGEVKDSFGRPAVFTGFVRDLREGYCFVAVTGIAMDVFAHASSFDAHGWEQVHHGGRVSCRIAFTLRGPTAQNCSAV